MLVGYARVSTQDQNLDLQKDALKKAGCERILVDQASGAKSERPGYNAAMQVLRKGDTLVVWRLDRLGRSLSHLLKIVKELEARQIDLKSLQESIDTGTSTGTLIFHMFGALAEFERNLIRERTMAGLTAAKARGKKGGRPKALDEYKREVAVKLYHEGKHTAQEVARIMGISRGTLYNYLK
jgi:DNA invertase Pin-like site-specific DNA recombinase